MSDLQRVGPVWGGSGTAAPFTAGASGAQRVVDAHGRFMDANLGGRVFSDGIATVLSISNVTFTIGTLGATCTPIAGLWNPATSPVNAVLLQATLNAIKTALQNTGCGPFYWATSIGNAAISTGSNPLNRRTLAAVGSFCKGYAGVALTGLTNNLVVRGASQLHGGSASSVAFLETQVGSQAPHVATRELFDGEWIIPPGGVIALLAGSTAVGVSASSMLVWEEVPILP